MSARAAGLILGYVADRLIGDPAHFHPVAGFGRVGQTIEGVLYGDSRLHGMAYTTVLVGGPVALGLLLERLTDRPVPRAAATAVATWVVLGGCSLERESRAVEQLLASDHLSGARTQVRRLVGRDTEEMDAGDIARAVIESVAENTSDAVVAPLVWGAMGGIPGLLGYRAINTLDAMVGHRTARHERFGWASARLDDLANLPGSRLAAVLTLIARPTGAPEAWRVCRRDAARHPSPNAGVIEAAFAGSLGLRLGGRNRYYGSRVEHRAIMGDGRAPGRGDIDSALRLARRVGVAATLTTAAACWVADQRRVRTQSPQ